MGAEKWVVIDAGGTREEVGEDIWEKVSPLAERMNEPVSKLWSSLLVLNACYLG